MVLGGFGGFDVELMCFSMMVCCGLVCGGMTVLVRVSGNCFRCWVDGNLVISWFVVFGLCVLVSIGVFLILFNSCVMWLFAFWLMGLWF